MSAVPPFWAALDAVVVINLDQRADRWAAMQAHLAGLVPAGKLHRLSAVRGVDLPGYGAKPWFGRSKRPATWAGRAGCALSHRNALRLLAQRGWRRALILEDDARFTAPPDEAAGAALAERWRGAEPQATFLGFNEPCPPVRVLAGLPGGGQVCSIGGCLAAHAYVVNAALAERLLAEMPREDAHVWAWLARHTAVDTWYSLRMARLGPVLAVSPAWVEQVDSHSDITQRASGGTPATALVPGGSDFGAAVQRAAAAPGRRAKELLRRLRGL